MKRFILPLIAALLLCSTLMLPARVFLKWGKKTTFVHVDDLGYDKAYNTTMKINGASADVEVMQSDRDMHSTLKQLKRLYEKAGGSPIIYRDGSTAWGIISIHKHIVRLLVVNLDDRPFPTVFRIRQSEAAYKKSKKKNTTARITKIPIYPGSQLSHSSEDELTKMQLEVSKTSAAPKQVRQFFSTALKKEGWSPALPVLTSPDNPLGTLIYTKRGRVCLISARASDTPGESVITLVHKKLGSGGP